MANGRYRVKGKYRKERKERKKTRTFRRVLKYVDDPVSHKGGVER
jgi:hypothetical protein